MFKRSFLLLLALALSAIAGPTVKDNFLRRAPHVGGTNAERFARGVGPAKPRKLFNSEVSGVETGLRPRQSPQPSEAPFDCIVLGSPYGYPVCCNPSQISEDRADEDGPGEVYEVSSGGCYYNYVTGASSASTGCHNPTDVPFCCSGDGPGNTVTEVGNTAYPDTYYTGPTHRCYEVTFT